MIKKFEEYIESGLDEVVSSNINEDDMLLEMAQMNLYDRDANGLCSPKYKVHILNKEGNKEPHFHILSSSEGFDIRVTIENCTLLSVKKYGKRRTDTFSDVIKLAKYWLKQKAKDIIQSDKTNKELCISQFFRMNPDSPYIKEYITQL